MAVYENNKVVKNKKNKWNKNGKFLKLDDSIKKLILMRTLEITQK